MTYVPNRACLATNPLCIATPIFRVFSSKRYANLMFSLVDCVRAVWSYDYHGGPCTEVFLW